MQLEALTSRLLLNGADDIAHTAGTLPETARDDFGVALGDRLAFVDSRRIHLYDPSLNSWKVATVPLGNYTIQYPVPTGQKLILPISSIGQFKPLRNILEYDDATATFNAIRLPVKLSVQGASSFGDTFLLLGVTRQGAEHLTSLAYNSKSGKWTTSISPISSSIYGNRSVVVGTKAYFQDGIPWNYDFNDNRWKKTALVLSGTLAVVGSKIIESSGQAINIYDTISGKLAAYPKKGYNSIATLGSKALIFSTENPDNPSSVATNIVDVYDTVDSSWTTTTLSVARGFPAVAATNKIAAFAGGRSINTNPYTTYDVVDFFIDNNPSAQFAGSVSGTFGVRNSVQLFNTGNADLSQPFSIQLFATTDRTLNSAILVGSMNVTNPLAGGASRVFSVRSIVPGAAPAGKYHLLAAVQDSAGLTTPIASSDVAYKLNGQSNPTAARSMLGAITGLFRRRT